MMLIIWRLLLECLFHNVFNIDFNSRVQSSITLLPSILANSTVSTDLVWMVLEEGAGYPSEVARSVVLTAYLMPSLADVSVNDRYVFFFSNAWKVIVVSDQLVNCAGGEFATACMGVA
jgi:hypothetical protein